MENNKFKVESLITDVELATESLGVILRDQENTMFQFEDTDGLIEPTFWKHTETEQPGIIP